jgi:hypothetical protein
MENRRKDYRHRLEAPGRLGAELTPSGRPAAVAAEVIDLSVSGLAVALPAAAAPTVGEACIVRLVATAERLDLKIPAVVIHRHDTPAGSRLGLHFPPLANPAANDNRERVLWRFLLEEQRRLRRRPPERRQNAG